MAKIRYWQLDDEEMMESLNKGKDALLRALIDDEVISEELADEISKKYLVQLVRPTLLSRLFCGEREKLWYVATKIPSCDYEFFSSKDLLKEDTKEN